MSKPWHVAPNQPSSSRRPPLPPPVNVFPLNPSTERRPLTPNPPMSAVSYEPVGNDYLRPYAVDDYYLDTPSAPTRPASWEAPRPSPSSSSFATSYYPYLSPSTSHNLNINGRPPPPSPFAGVESPIWSYPEGSSSQPPTTYEDVEEAPRPSHQTTPSTGQQHLQVGSGTTKLSRTSTKRPRPSTKDPFFYEYSACTGRRKALLIGINYTGVIKEDLKGCHNDVKNMKRFLIEKYGYKRKDMVILLDDPSRGRRETPTRKNIIDAMKWLVKDAKVHDSLFFHFSGHGGQTPDLDGDEDDGYDEVIYPVDFKTSGHIVDDEMHNILVRPLPAGCRLTAIFDCCNSGTALDLPYIYSTEGKIKEPNILADIKNGLFGAIGAYSRNDIAGIFKAAQVASAKVANGEKAQERTRKGKTSPADVISWSGCKDSQQSADTTQNGQATGAMSWAFIKALNSKPKQSYNELLNSIRRELRGKYAQKPQLSASHPLDQDLLFVM